MANSMADFYRKSLAGIMGGGYAGTPAQRVGIPGMPGLGAQKVAGLGGMSRSAFPVDFDPINPDAPDAPPPGGNPALGAWQNFLKLLGTTADPRAEASNWLWKNGLMFRRNMKGFDMFGLAPQEIYEANLAGNGLDREPTTRIGVDAFWKNYMNPGDWGAHEDPNAPGVAKNWLKQDLDQLQSVWGKLSGAERQMFRDRMLQGTGLPAYLQAFLKARPQWITDYISKTFV